MSVLDVLQLDQDDDQLNVVALVDDAAIRWHATYSQPTEYQAALCSTTILLGEPFDPDQLSEEDLKVFLEEAALEWVPIDTSDW